jgi:hypothetical protein
MRHQTPFPSSIFHGLNVLFRVVLDAVYDPIECIGFHQ